jgi:hypothetical protein
MVGGLFLGLYFFGATAVVSTGPVIHTTSLPDGEVGVVYGPVISSADTGEIVIVTGGAGRSVIPVTPYVVSIVAGSLPAGLSVNDGVGTLAVMPFIEGTPTAAGVSTFTLQVADTNGQTAAQGFTITVVLPRQLASGVVELELNGVWTDVLADMPSDQKLSIEYGIAGTGPLDRIASTGICRFQLRSLTHGYYSPGHVNCRPGFTHGIPIRVTFTLGVTQYTKFRGKLYDIRPTPGQFKHKRVDVMAVDGMEDLATFIVRDIDPQAAKSTDALLQEIVDAMPAEAQPVAVDFDAGLDTFPYAFQNVGNGVSGLALAADVVKSEIGFLYQKGDGTLRFENRNTIQSTPITVNLTDDEINSLEVPSTLQETYNGARVTIHPPRIDGSDVVLFAFEPAVAGTSLAAGETRIFSFPYRDPTNEQTRIGGTQFVEPVVATTDYLGNTQADGLGTNKTALLTVVADFRASLAIVSVTNTDPGAVFLTKLQGRGRGVYDGAPVTAETILVQDYGQRVLEHDMPYQDDFNIAQSLANYLAAQYQSLTNRATSVSFNPHQNAVLALAAMELEPGSRLTITERITALSVAPQRVQRVSLTLSSPLRLRASYTVTPAFVTDAWILEDAEKSILETSTIMGVL